MRIVIAVHDPPIWSLPSREVDRIQATLVGDEVVEVRDTAGRLREFPSAEVLVTARISDEEFAAARRVRWIHTTATGVDTLLTPAVVRSEVVITNSRGVHAEQIAEHAIALTLALRRGLHIARSRQIERRWAQVELEPREMPALSRTHMLVVGLGAIGARIAALAWALGVRVIGVRKRADAPVPAGVAEVLPPEALHDGLGQADIVVLALPGTDDTRALIGAAEIEAMRPSALLINVARGRLVDETALVEALARGRIAGAGLDAFAVEPLPDDSPLWRLPNVLITPHTASFDGDYWAPAVDLFLDNCERFRRGEPLFNIVDKGRGY